MGDCGVVLVGYGYVFEGSVVLGEGFEDACGEDGYGVGEFLGGFLGELVESYGFLALDVAEGVGVHGETYVFVGG